MLTPRRQGAKKKTMQRAVPRFCVLRALATLRETVFGTCGSARGPSFSGLLEALPALRAVYVFGTVGTPYMRADSVLDLAFLGEHAEDPVRVWDLAQRIAGLVGASMAEWLRTLRLDYNRRQVRSLVASRCD